MPTGRPYPRLDIWAAPTATDQEWVRLRYRRKWVNAYADDDTLYIPEFCEPLFLRVCEEVEMGLHQIDGVPMEQRLDAIKATNLFNDAAREDATLNDEGGQPLHGAAERAHLGRIHYGLVSFVADPS